MKRTLVRVGVLGDLKSNKKGITLVALIITIIVLLILAGISISLLTGENNIIEKSKQAKTETEISQEKEAIQLSYTNAKMERVFERRDNSKSRRFIKRNE